MDRLLALYEEFGQSPWLDNLQRGYLTSGQLARFRDGGIRGLTSNPTIMQKAIEQGADYREQFAGLVTSGTSLVDQYWGLVLADIEGALDVFAPLHESSGGADGFVSVEVAPDLAHQTDATVQAARALHEQLARPNLLVKVPATAEGVGAIEQLIADGHSINVTLIFSLDRYAEVMEAYLRGLERYAADGGTDLGTVASVASFFISRVDTEVDRRLETIGTPEALALRGQAAVAQGKLAYQAFAATFSGPRWDALRARGARVQRPLWASTSTKNPAYPDTLYVDTLIGPDTVNTLPEPTIAAFADHGVLARTVDDAVDEAEATWAALDAVGVDLDDVAATLEREGVTAFQKSFDGLLDTLAAQGAEVVS